MADASVNAPIQFACSNCGAALSAPADKGGSSITCESCHAVAMVPQPSMASQPEGIAAMASAEAIDPNASPEFKAASAPAADAPKPPQRQYPPRRASQSDAARPAVSSRSALMGVSAVVVLGVLAFAGLSISNGMQRTKIEQEVTVLVTNAKNAVSVNDMDLAIKNVKDAQERIKTSPQELDPDQKKKWDAQLGKITDLKEQVTQLDKIFADAEKDLSGTRDKLMNKKTLLGAVTDENRPAVLKVETLLADLEKLEQKQKVTKLQADLANANKLYADGKIEDAAEKAETLVRDMASKPPVQDEAIESRTRVLRKRAEQLKAARDIRLSSKSGNYANAKRDLTKQLEAIDETNADLKPLYAKINELKISLNEEEKRTKKINPDDAKELTNLVHNLKNFDRSLEPEKLEGETVGLKVDGKSLRLGYLHEGKDKQLFIDSAGNRLRIEMNDLQRHPLRVLQHAKNLGEAMKKAEVGPDVVWDAHAEAPLVSARRMGEDGKEYVFLGDRVYVGAPEPKDDARVADRTDFEKKTEALAAAVKKDTATPEEVRQIMLEDIHATIKEADWYDHLPGEYVRKVIADGYIEKNMPGSAERLKKELAEWREAYTKLNKPVFNFSGTSKTGDEATEFRTLEDHPIWRTYDKESDTTTFAIDNPDDEKNCLFILYDFPGKVETFSDSATPKRVRMTHQAVGVTASYDPASGKMEANMEPWNLAAALELPPTPPDYRLNKGMGTPSWALPPHVLLVDYYRNTKSIVTPFGKLDIKDFRSIPEPQRTKEMEAFLNQMAKVLPTANYLHLYFRYFFEYILDSPVTSQPELLGSRPHCGDIHQTTYQSLSRMMGGRYVGDCDDLAEFFMNVTRRQGKLSFVMALPQHAACGWVEKHPGETEYIFHIDDTGPPRIFRNPDMDKVIEMAERAYDDDNTMRFDPKSLGFLFRFNNEPTRTPYYLSSRMFVDKDYGEAMERVQSYWHFHFYKLGIETMTTMIEKGDRVPENCIELAGLYGQIREVESSVKWTNEALKQFSPEEKLSRMSEEFRIGLMWRTEHNNQKSYDAIKKTVDELKDLYSSPQTFSFSSTRHEFMGLLVSIDRPWEAWDLVSREIIFLARKGELKSEHVGGLTGVYQKMKDQIRDGKKPTKTETDEMGNLEKILDWFYANRLFERSDDFGDIQRKYAFLSTYYAGKQGEEKLTAELLKGGPFPSPAKPRDHTNRKDPEAEDWNWIRMALPSYSIAIGQALDMDDPPEKWRRDDAIKLTDAMTKAAEQTKQFGSLASAEFQLMSAQVFRAFLAKDWAGLEKVVAETEKRNWARLTSDVAESFGRGARFVTPEEFKAQYRMFTKHIKSRPSYFTVIYEAYRADAIEQAIAATSVALECNPGDEDMKREATYLAELGRKKLERIAKEKAEKKDSPAASKTDAKKEESKKE